MQTLTFIFEGRSSPRFRDKDIRRAREEAAREIIQEDFPDQFDDIRIEEKARDILEDELVIGMRRERDEIAHKIISRVRFSYPNSVVNSEVIFSKGSLEFTAIVTVINIIGAAYTIQQTVDNIAISVEKIVGATIKEHAQTSSHMRYQGVDIGNMSVGLVSKSTNAAPNAPIQNNVIQTSDYHQILSKIYITIRMLIAVCVIGLVLYGYDIYHRSP